MTAVDYVIIGFAVVFGLVGFARGFLVGVLSLAGFVAGAYIGTRFGPQLLSDGNESPYAPLFGLLGAVIAGTIISAGAESMAGSLRASMRSSAFGAVDGLLGAALAVALALGFAWVIGVIVLQTPGVSDVRRTVQRSAILDKLNDVLPSDTLLKALARFDPFPRVDGPEVDVGPPSTGAAGRPGRAACRRLGRPGARQRVRPAGLGLGLGRGRRDGRDERARRRRPGGHGRRDSRPRAARGGRRRVRLEERHRRAARARTCA